jgi:hypothetical protein
LSDDNRYFSAIATFFSWSKTMTLTNGQHAAVTRKLKRAKSLAIELYSLLYDDDDRRANKFRKNHARVGSKAHKIGEMLLRARGASKADILRATGWPSVSVPAQARVCGLTLNTRRVRGVLRYYA